MVQGQRGVCTKNPRCFVPQPYSSISLILLWFPLDNRMSRRRTGKTGEDGSDPL